VFHRTSHVASAGAHDSALEYAKKIKNQRHAQGLSATCKMHGAWCDMRHEMEACVWWYIKGLLLATYCNTLSRVYCYIKGVSVGRIDLQLGDMRHRHVRRHSSNWCLNHKLPLKHRQCNTLQRTATLTHCITHPLHHSPIPCAHSATSARALHNTAPRRTTLQHTCTQCDTKRHAWAGGSRAWVGRHADECVTCRSM